MSRAVGGCEPLALSNKGCGALSWCALTMSVPSHCAARGNRLRIGGGSCKVSTIAYEENIPTMI